MVTTVKELVAMMNHHLQSEHVQDYGPNGLQVDGGNPEVRSVCTGVTANLEFIQRAIAWGADLLVVHHGIYWNGAPFQATGALGRRIRTLMEAGTSLAAYHLPLDAHPELGNAAGFVDALGLDEVGRMPAFEHRGLNVGTVVTLSEPISAQSLLENVRSNVNPDALMFPGGPESIRRLGVVTGGAARDVPAAANDYQCDAFITGEAGEYSRADAHEEGIHVVAAGHHRSERFGPQAMSEWLKTNVPELRTCFIDVDNPV